MKRTILYITSTLRDEGYVNLVWYLAQQMSPEKYRAIVCCMREGGPYIEKFQDLGVTVLNLNMKNYLDLRAVPKLVKFMKQNRVDIVHTNVRLADWYGRICARLAKVPIIFSTIHSTDYWRKDRRYFVYALFDRLSLVLNTHLIAVSHAVKDFLIQWQRVDPGKITVIWNGIPISRYLGVKRDPDLVESLNLSNDKVVIGIVARLVKQKAIHNLLNAVKIIAQDRKDFQLIIVGNGPLTKKLQNQAKKLGLEDHVLFAGFRTDIPELLSVFDIFVMSSVNEGLCLAIIEAMIAGLPVVATNVDGINELVINNETGILVPPECPEAFAEGVRKLLDSPELRKKMGECGKTRALGKFSIERMSREHEEFYDLHK